MIKIGPTLYHLGHTTTGGRSNLFEKIAHAFELKFEPVSPQMAAYFNSQLLLFSKMN